MRVKILTIRFTLKKQWFDKIVSGEKTVEYREYKPYWITRLAGAEVALAVDNNVTAIFRNGYKKDAPTVVKQIVGISIVDGRNTDLKFNGKVYAIEVK